MQQDIRSARRVQAPPVTADDGSYQIDLPNAAVQVWPSDHEPGMDAASVVVDALLVAYPDAAGWDVAEPTDGWIEALGWATGSGATTTFSGTGTDGAPIVGVAALLIDPDGTGELYVAAGDDAEDPDNAIVQAHGALDALTWGCCDPDAEITDHCPTV